MHVICGYVFIKTSVYHDWIINNTQDATYCNAPHLPPDLSYEKQNETSTNAPRDNNNVDVTNSTSSVFIFKTYLFCLTTFFTYLLH